MKILEAQSATLTNYEVFTHLKAQRNGSRKNGRPTDLDNMVHELFEYFKDPAWLSPLASKPLTYNERTIKTLLQRLRHWDFTKGEVIMILNHRPAKPENLNTMVQEMEQRFTDEEQLEIVQIIAEVLGKPDVVEA
ncbi:hypothetical protein LZ554_009509 [Drepanopeziza brunnea f. sp. 'monogermtubi']|nr:hypothetical protein LZ554_009509 [Drepanopeziza brunnea f. sp. 'monogermtubi']